ncbi:MAG: nitroreductase family protein [Desulfatiglandales bacterium]
MKKSCLLDVIHSRRSVRRFLANPIEKRHLDQILDAARVAPSGGNLQGWRFIVVQKRDLIARIESAIRKEMLAFMHEFPKVMRGNTENSEYYASSLIRRLESSSLFFAGAPVIIAVLYELNLYNQPYIDFLMRTGKDRYEAYRSMGYVEVQSVAAATQNMLLAAHSLGYGCCWMNVPFIALKEIKEILGIFHPWELSALIPIGRPDPRFTPNPPRKKMIEEIVTYR